MKINKAAILLIIAALVVMMFTGCSSVQIPALKEKNLEKTYDVIVVGGEPEGVAAAVSAARNGAKTLLVEHRDGLGGLFTYSALNFLDVGRDMKGEFANAGIFKEWHDLVDNKIGFDIDQAEQAFNQLVESEKNLTVSLNTRLVSVEKKGNKLSAINIMQSDGSETTIQADAFIDSTQDGDLAVLSGAPYFIGGEDRGFENVKMAVTLVLPFKNVNWEKVKKAGKDGVFGGGVVDENVGWGFSDFHFDYPPSQENVRLRGLNIVRQQNGDIYINALQIFGVDGLNEQEKNQAIEVGKKEAELILTFLQKHFPGFENAVLGEFPEELYVRETRHILAEYQLPMSDIWENRDHWDRVALGAYPVDIQATGPKDYGMIVSAPIQYAIPFRSLVPLEVDGLLVASKASGYSSVAAGSARVVPTGMSVGQAAGVVAAWSVKKGESFREISKNKEYITSLQEKLADQGARIYPFTLPYTYENEWYYPAVKLLLNQGLIGGGYQNILPVDQPITVGKFLSIIEGLSGLLQSEHLESSEFLVRDTVKNQLKDQTLNRDQAAQIALNWVGEDASEDKAWRLLAKRGILDTKLLELLPVDRELTGKEAYYLAYLMYREVSVR